MIFTEALGIRIYVIPSLDLVVTRSGEQEMDALPSVLRRDVEGVVPGRLGAAGTHESSALGCEGESNDGIQRYVGDIPRTIPGIVGAETRPDSN